MDAWREVQKALAAHQLGWQDIWKATVDRKLGEVVLITADGRKFTHPLGVPRGTAARTHLVKPVAGEDATGQGRP